MTKSLLHKGPGRLAIPEPRDKFVFQSHILRGKGKFIALDQSVWVRGESTAGYRRYGWKGSQQSDDANLFYFPRIFNFNL